MTLSLKSTPVKDRIAITATTEQITDIMIITTGFTLFLRASEKIKCVEFSLDEFC